MRIELLGDSNYGGWLIDTHQLNKKSIVYSFGVGDNISWDLEMIRRFDCTIHAFDPTPYSIQWIRHQTLPQKFIFHPIGVSNFDGTQTFFSKRDIITNKNLSEWIFNGESSQLPVKKLSTLMAELGHRHIDVLKLDIEGSEYKVLQNMQIAPQQILVEFHNKTSKRLHYPYVRLLLLGKGYKHVGHRGDDHLFVI